MKAENLTISIPAACLKNCPYCISKVTWSPPVNKRAFWRNLDNALFLAKQSGVSKILVTSKGEPMNEIQMAIDLLAKCQPFITELQTNGDLLITEPDQIYRLSGVGLNVLAYSIDQLDQLKAFFPVTKIAHTQSMTVRATCIMTSGAEYGSDLTGIAMYAREMGIDQLTFRVPSLPAHDIKHNQGVQRWIDEHYDEEWADGIIKQLGKWPIVRKLNFDNVEIFDVYNVAVTYIGNCVQEFSHDTDIRSLIFHQDGHMYTSWAYPGSRIF